MPDPDLEIRGRGAGVASKKSFFRPFGPQFGLKIRVRGRGGGGGAGTRAPPLAPLL